MQTTTLQSAWLSGVFEGVRIRMVVNKQLLQLTKHPETRGGIHKKIVPYERKKNMKKLSKKNKIRQIKLLNKKLQKIKRRKNKRVKDEKKQPSENVSGQKIARYRIII